VGEGGEGGGAGVPNAKRGEKKIKFSWEKEKKGGSKFFRARRCGPARKKKGKNACSFEVGKK